MGNKRSGKITRKPATRNPYKVIHMVFEGRLTEPQYIDSFIRSREKKIAVPGEFIRGAGEPRKIIETCIEIKENIIKESRSAVIGTTDEIWAVFDVDAHENLMEAIRMAKEHRIPCAISNPCIEVWGALHEATLDQPLSRHEAQRLLKNKIPKYNHNKNPTFDWNWCFNKIEAAAKNAVLGREARAAENSRFPSDSPTTNFDRLLSEFDKKIETISNKKTWSEW
ncbi:RloB family protein [Alcaligenes sp. Me129]|uniref:RloB family protein n=1 Tax=Alcaligenes sp. Me129 TaxID=3392635 RepID=UPI003D1DCDC1